jgi:hypothetical protein
MTNYKSNTERRIRNCQEILDSSKEYIPIPRNSLFIRRLRRLTQILISLKQELYVEFSFVIRNLAFVIK